MTDKRVLELITEIRNCSLEWDDEHYEALGVVEGLLKEKCGISKQQKIMKKITPFLIIVIVFLCVFIGIQTIEIKYCHESIKEWEELSVMWREKLDTCHERNARIYDELFNLQEYKIMKLKEQGAIK